jgi:hypothetical protein
MKRLGIFALVTLAVSTAASGNAYHVLYKFPVTAGDLQPATIVIGRDGGLYGLATVSGCTQNCGNAVRDCA